MKSGRAVWRFEGDGYLDGSPLVVNRAEGTLVVPALRRVVAYR